eukprot:m.107212 g.107212  ORF g.107212 m.107212 type:complete len:236 (+) comp15833_c0_seq1:1390-2097(+)
MAEAGAAAAANEPEGITAEDIAAGAVDPNDAAAVAAAAADPANRRLFIGGLDFRLKEAHVIKILQKCGKLTFFDYLYHRFGPDRGKPRGFCFAEYETKEESEKAIKLLNGKMALSKRLRVHWAADKSEPEPSASAATAAKRAEEEELEKTADEDVRTQLEINTLEMKLRAMQEGIEPQSVSIPMVTRASMAEEAALVARNAHKMAMNRSAPYSRGGGGGRGGSRGGGRGGGRGRR